MARLTPSMPWLPPAMLGVSFAGFLDASYLTVKHFTNTAIPCSLTHGCEIVTNSVYSDVFGIPVALLGALFYLTVFLGIFAALESGSRTLLRLAARLTIAGVLSSAWFVFVQLVLLHAICQWCMASALTSTVLFVLGYIFVPKALRAPAAKIDQQPTPGA